MYCVMDVAVGSVIITLLYNVMLILPRLQLRIFTRCGTLHAVMLGPRTACPSPRIAWKAFTLPVSSTALQHIDGDSTRTRSIIGWAKASQPGGLNGHCSIYWSGNTAFWSPRAPALRANVKPAQSHPVKRGKTERAGPLYVLQASLG